MIRQIAGQLADSTLPLWKACGVKFTLGGITFIEDFLIANTLLFPVVIGFPWWYKHQINFNYQNKTLFGLKDDWFSVHVAFVKSEAYISCHIII